MKRVCIIGAGIAGLTSARYLKDEGINFTVFEATKYVGGAWRYDPRTGTDENGLPIFTSMYKNLRTNLPIPTMELKDFPLPGGTPSFPGWEVFYDYLKSYTKHFDVEKYIKFEHLVIMVRRVDNFWKVKYKNLVTSDVFEDEFDYVIVGNGHFSKPNMPNIEGEELFKGTLIHSHDYKVPYSYKDRRVLVVGGGPSGMDIVLDVANYCKSIIHSHHSKTKIGTPFPPHYVRKPDIKEFNETGAIFVDGTYAELDDVIYCTGYQLDYSFLDDSCGLDKSPHTLTPLYRYMVNINQPSMVVMGLTVHTCLVVTLDAQSRYAAALIKGDFKLPTREVMMQEWQRRVDDIQSEGLRMRHIHFLADKEDEYYAELSEESGIDRVPPVIYKMRARDTLAKRENLYTYRNYVYTVIDDNNFVRDLEQN